MAIEYDAVKDERNRRVHGVGLDRYAELDPGSMRVSPDARRDYGEPRFRVLAFLDGRLHAAVVTPRGTRTRVISLRPANRRERQAYAKATEPAG